MSSFLRKTTGGIVRSRRGGGARGGNDDDATDVSSADGGGDVIDAEMILGDVGAPGIQTLQSAFLGANVLGRSSWDSPPCRW